MTVVTLWLDLRLAGRPTPRAARRQLEAIMEKLHRHFNVSVAAAEGASESDVYVLLAAAVGRTRKDARATLERVADALAAHPRVDVVAHASRRPEAGAPKRQSSISSMARSVWRNRPSASQVRITMSRSVRSMRSRRRSHAPG